MRVAELDQQLPASHAARQSESGLSSSVGGSLDPKKLPDGDPEAYRRYQR
jgi:hypothetical protein